MKDKRGSGRETSSPNRNILSLSLQLVKTLRNVISSQLFSVFIKSSQEGGGGTEETAYVSNSIKVTDVQTNEFVRGAA